MTHPRTEIRRATVALLDGVPALRGRVKATRIDRAQTDDLPLVSVYALNEASSHANVARDKRRDLSLAIEIRVAGSADLDDRLDDLASLVEEAFDVDPRLGNVALDSALTATAIGLDGEGESRQAIATLTYAVTYFTTAN